MKKDLASGSVSFMHRVIAIVLIALLLPIVPIQSAAAEDLRLSIGKAAEGQDAVISWNAVNGASSYHYALVDETAGIRIYDHGITTNLYFGINGAYIIEGHRYKVWVAAYAENDDYLITEVIEYFSATAKEGTTTSGGVENPDPAWVSFTASSTEVTIGDTVTFTISTNAPSVTFIVDNEAYESINVENGSARFSRRFSAQGDRQVCFEAPDGNRSSVQTIRVNAQGALETPIISAPSSVRKGQTFTASWNDVEHADAFVVRLYYSANNAIHSWEMAEKSISFSTDELEVGHVYKLHVMAKGANYSQSENSVDFTVLPSGTTATTQISLSANRTEITVGDTVQFTITTNATSADLYVDGTHDPYDTVSVSNGQAAYTRQFHQEGDRQVWAVTPDGTRSGTVTIHVTDKGQLGQTTVSVPSSVTIGQDVNASWTTVEHAQEYYVRLFDSDKNELWRQITTGTSATIPGYLLEANRRYMVHVMPTAEGYSQSEGGAEFVVTEAGSAVSTQISFTADKTEATVGETVLFTISTNAAFVRFVVDGVTYDTIETASGSTTFSRAFHEQGDRQVCFEAPDGTRSSVRIICVSAMSMLDKAMITVPSSVRKGEDVNASWSLVEHAEEYYVRLYDSAGSVLWTQTTSNTYVTVPGSLLEADRQYSVNVMATARNYSQSENGAAFTVLPAGTTVSARLDFTADKTAVTIGESVGFTIVTNAESVRFFVNNTPYSTIDTSSGSAAFSYAFNEPGEKWVWVEAPDGTDSVTRIITVTEKEQQEAPDKLGAPVITSPSSGAVISGVSFTLAWNAVDGADHYLYTLYDITAGETVYNATETAFLSASLTVPARDHTYRAAVGAAPAGESAGSDLIGWNSVTFSVSGEAAEGMPAYIPDFTATVTTSGFGGDVTVHWTAPVWPENPAWKLDEYAVEWHGEAFNIPMTFDNNTFSAVLPGESTLKQADYSVDVYARIYNGTEVIQKKVSVQFRTPSPFVGSPTLEAAGTAKNGNQQYRVTAVTDAKITRLSAENNNGYPLRETWEKTNNANGTITWSRVYEAEVSADNRTWTLTAWVNGQACGSATTNRVSVIHVHNFGEKQYDTTDHPHQYYRVCKGCGLIQKIPNEYYTANGQVQDPTVCCICHGHIFGNVNVENRGYAHGNTRLLVWYQECINCGIHKVIPKPQIDIIDEAFTTLSERDSNTGEIIPDKALSIASVDLINLEYGLDTGKFKPYIDGKHTIYVPNSDTRDYLELDLGFTDVKDFNATPGEHTVGYTFAYKLITDENGNKVPLFAVIIRGSYGDLMLLDPEWKSDFTVGGGEEHYGFKIAEMDLIENLNRYINSHLADGETWINGNYKLWITGHSRGAAVGNLLAGDYIKVLGNDSNIRAYLFATPRTTKNPIQSDNIINFIMDGDPVPRLPLSGWGYSRNGETIILENQKNLDELEMNAFEDALNYLMPDPMAASEIVEIWNNWNNKKRVELEYSQTFIQKIEQLVESSINSSFVTGSLSIDPVALTTCLKYGILSANEDSIEEIATFLNFVNENAGNIEDLINRIDWKYLPELFSGFSPEKAAHIRSTYTKMQNDFLNLSREYGILLISSGKSITNIVNYHVVNHILNPLTPIIIPELNLMSISQLRQDTDSIKKSLKACGDYSVSIVNDSCEILKSFFSLIEEINSDLNSKEIFGDHMQWNYQEIIHDLFDK